MVFVNNINDKVEFIIENSSDDTIQYFWFCVCIFTFLVGMGSTLFYIERLAHIPIKWFLVTSPVFIFVIIAVVEVCIDVATENWEDHLRVLYILDVIFVGIPIAVHSWFLGVMFLDCGVEERQDDGPTEMLI